MVRITNPLNQWQSGLVCIGLCSMPVEAQSLSWYVLTLSNISICWIIRKKLHLYVFQNHTNIFQSLRIGGASNNVQRKIQEMMDS